MVEKFQENVNPDWEHAFDRFESVIASGSEAMRLEVLTKLSSLSKLAPEHVLARAIPILARLLGDDTSNNSRPVQEAAAYCLYRIACRGEGRIAIEIGQSGAVLSILRFLPHSDNGFQRILVKCLWGFVTFGTENRVDVARNGGLETIIDMLKSCTDDDTRRYLLEILSALTLLREVRRIIASLGGLGFLVEAASCGSMVSRERACQAIGLLGVTRRGRCMLFELGVIPVLVELFRDGDIKTKLVAGNSLGIISSHVSHIRLAAQAGAIPLYAGLLQGPEPLGKEIAEDVLCILAVAEPNAVVIVEHLVRILREGDDEAKAAAADVLWDLSGYKHSVSVVRNSGAIPILVDLLSDRSVEVKEKVSGAIAQLSYDEAHRLALANTGAIQVLIELLHDESEELKDNAAEALINFSEDPLQHDRVSEALDVPSFQSMQNRMVHIRASDERTVRSMRWMSIEQLSRNLDLV